MKRPLICLVIIVLSCMMISERVFASFEDLTNGLSNTTDGFMSVGSDATGSHEEGTPALNPSGVGNDAAVFSYAGPLWIEYGGNMYWLVENDFGSGSSLDASLFTTVNVTHDDVTASTRTSQYTIAQLPGVTVNLFQEVVAYNIVYTFTFTNTTDSSIDFKLGSFNDLDMEWGDGYQYNYVGFYLNGAFIRTNADEQVSLLTDSPLDGAVAFITTLADGTLHVSGAYDAYSVIEDHNGDISSYYGKFLGFQGNTIFSTDNYDANHDDVSDVSSDVSFAAVWDIGLVPHGTETITMAWVGGDPAINSEEIPLEAKIPTLSEWGIIIMSILLGITAVVYIRRQRMGL